MAGPSTGAADARVRGDRRLHGLGVTARIRLALAVVPIAAVAAIHASGAYALVIVRSGFVAYPTIAMFGWWFLLLAGVGVIAGVMERARTVVLWSPRLPCRPRCSVVDMDSAARPTWRSFAGGGDVPGDSSAAPLTLSSGPGSGPRIGPRTLPWALVGILAIVIARPLAAAPRPKPIVSQPLNLAGQWARANVPPGCVDYLVTNVYTAYWLHIAVLGNARASARSGDDDTYQPKQTLNRWILGGGVPYAITENFEGLPRDIRTNVDVIARFGPAAVVKRRGPSSCRRYFQLRVLPSAIHSIAVCRRRARVSSLFASRSTRRRVVSG